MNALPWLSADFEVTDTGFVLSGTKIVVLRQNPSRWGFVVGSFSGPTICWMSTNPAADSVSGMQINPSSLPIAFNFRDFGGMVSQQWFGYTNGAGGNIWIMEILYKPKGHPATEAQMAELARKLGK